MGIVELLLIAVGLAMDAFAVSICKGLAMRRVHYGHAFVIALAFGLFQALMPLLGWLLGSSFQAFIEPFDHWIAFGLLAAIGVKMIWDAFHEEPNACPEEEQLDYRELFVLAIATSIDALAVGVSFALLSVNIWVAITVIGVVTFGLSFIGVVIGNHFGLRFERTATIIGGIVLIVIGLRILLEGLGIFSF